MGQRCTVKCCSVITLAEITEMPIRNVGDGVTRDLFLGLWK